MTPKQPLDPSYPVIEGTNRPGAFGHNFNEDLDCANCEGVTWFTHQAEPTPCPNPRPEHITHSALGG